MKPQATQPAPQTPMRPRGSAGERPRLGERLRGLGEAMRVEIREHRSTFVVYMLLRVLVLVMMVLQCFNGNYENVFLCLLTLVLFAMPAFIQVTFQVELPSTLEIIVLLFIFAAEALGEISEFYVLFPFWDTVLHTLNGFLAAAIGLSMADLLNRSETVKFQLSPLFLAFSSFTFSMTIGVLWEFFEFGMDRLFGLDMQKDAVVHSIHSVLLDPTHSNITVSINGITTTSVNGIDLGVDGYLDIGLIDTMNDLLVNFVGALVFSVIGFVYLRNRGRSSFLRRLVPRRKRRPTQAEQA